MKFYQDTGIPYNELISTSDKRYIGGYAVWNQEKGGLHRQQGISRFQNQLMHSAMLMSTAVSIARRYQSLS